jgi:nitrogen fixation protein
LRAAIPKKDFRETGGLARNALRAAIPKKDFRETGG